MKLRAFITPLILAAALPAILAGNHVNDSEPAILEVHYSRTVAYDTTKRATRFCKDPVMLRIGKHKSVFCGVKKLWQDSIMAVDPATFWDMEAVRIMSDKRDDTQLTSGHYWNYIYKNIPEGKVTERCYFNLERWQYTEDWEKPEWEITDGSREIIGYRCFKATADYRGRRWTAWFTPEIPVQEDPWKLCGLPGLVMKAETDDGEYGFAITGLQQCREPFKPTLINPDRLYKTKRKSFLKMKDYSRRNRSAQISAMTKGKVTVNADYKGTDDYIETDYQE